MDLTTDALTLADNAVAALQAKWPGWQPNDGDLEVVQIEALAPMAQNAAETAALAPPAIFRKFGTDLYGVPYQAGSASSTTTTWSIVANPTGRTIPAGAQINIDGTAFAVFADQVLAAGVLSVSGVIVVATQTGSAANGLAGASVSLISALDWVSGVTVATATAGGSDEEFDDAYDDRLARELQLRAKTLVTSRDFEIIALSQPGVGRATASNNGSRAVSVTIADAFGEVVPTPTKTALIAIYATYRQVNTVVTVSDPTYTTVNVVYTVKAYPGFDPTDLTSRINAMLAGVLSPAQWGQPTTFGNPGSPAWFNETSVRLNKIINLIGDVQGVDYVVSLTLNGAAADLTLSGTVPLTRAGTTSGTIT